jgi:hypothetical protein
MLKATHKQGGIAVTNQHGEIMTFVLVEKTYVAPAATPDEAYQAGAAADLAIDVAARNAGCTTVVLVLSENHPHFPEERWIRVIERAVPQRFVMGGVASDKSASSTKFIN